MEVKYSFKIICGSVKILVWMIYQYFDTSLLSLHKSTPIWCFQIIIWHQFFHEIKLLRTVHWSQGRYRSSYEPRPTLITCQNTWLIASQMRVYRVMITQESIDGQRLEPYGRLRFGLHMSEFVSFGRGAQPRQLKLTLGVLGALGPRITKTWSGTVVVRAARRHVLYNKGENVSRYWVCSGCDVPDHRTSTGGCFEKVLGLQWSRVLLRSAHGLCLMPWVKRCLEKDDNDVAAAGVCMNIHSCQHMCLIKNTNIFSGFWQTVSEFASSVHLFNPFDLEQTHKHSHTHTHLFQHINPERDCILLADCFPSYSLSLLPTSPVSTAIVISLVKIIIQPFPSNHPPPPPLPMLLLPPPSLSGSLGREVWQGSCK